MESCSLDTEPNSMRMETDTLGMEFQSLIIEIRLTSKVHDITWVKILSSSIEPDSINMKYDTAYVRSQSLRMELNLTSIDFDIPCMKSQSSNMKHYLKVRNLAFQTLRECLLKMWNLVF